MNNKLSIGIIFGVLLLYCASIGFNYCFFDKWEKRGQFGDMFGAVNALFSGLAFTGVIIAILIQRDELSLQRKELELNRKELAGQKNS